METLAHWLPVGSRGNKADRAMRRQDLQATAKPSAGVPRRSSLNLWSLEGEPEFRRTRLRALQQRARKNRCKRTRRCTSRRSVRRPDDHLRFSVNSYARRASKASALRRPQLNPRLTVSCNDVANSMGLI